VLYPFVVADAGGWHPLLRLVATLLHRMRCSAQWTRRPGRDRRRRRARYNRTRPVKSALLWCRLRHCP